MKTKKKPNLRLRKLINDALRERKQLDKEQGKLLAQRKR